MRLRDTPPVRWRARPPSVHLAPDRPPSTGYGSVLPVCVAGTASTGDGWLGVARLRRVGDGFGMRFGWGRLARPVCVAGAASVGDGRLGVARFRRVGDGFGMR